MLSFFCYHFSVIIFFCYNFFRYHFFRFHFYVIIFDCYNFSVIIFCFNLILILILFYFYFKIFISFLCPENEQTLVCLKFQLFFHTSNFVFKILKRASSTILFCLRDQYWYFKNPVAYTSVRAQWTYTKPVSCNSVNNYPSTL